jgi:hypothetical protein
VVAFLSPALPRTRAWPQAVPTVLVSFHSRSLIFEIESNRHGKWCYIVAVLIATSVLRKML